MYLARTWPVLVCVLALGACGGDAVPPAPDGAVADAGADAGSDAALGDPSAALFEREELLEVAITMKPDDWDILRYQGRSLAELAEGCIDGQASDPYSYFAADVTIDGVTIRDVGVRKKGYFGSLLVGRPSLKLKLDEYVPGQALHGLERLTLNNNRQDGSQIRQCLTYWAFDRAGIPAPRCTLARVTVNGQDMGIYSHIESIDEQLLARHFSNPTGALFEGQLSDFTPELLVTLQDKDGRASEERDQLEMLVAALAVDDAELVAAVSQWVDIDAFLRFWAMEVLVGHWDGYSGNRNNFFVYRNPDNGLLYFLPWGVDSTLSPRLIVLPGQPESVAATGQLAYRLYGLPEMRARYVEVMRELLAEVWSEEALLAELERLAVIAGSGADARDLDVVRTYIQERRAIFENELQAGPPAWEYPPQGALCLSTVGTVNGTFSTVWGTSGSPTPPEGSSASMSLVLDGQPVTIAAATASSGMGGVVGPQQPMVQLVGMRPEQPPLIVLLLAEPELFHDRSLAGFHGFGTVGVILEAGGPPLGFISGGSIQFQQAGMQPDAPVSGSFSGFVYRFPGQ